ncbi:MAG: FtsX-like permease family protein [Calditrichaeota bacterium]|nr:MAG: FtsX-like permease family protein [Calditrichota bacterium]
MDYIELIRTAFTQIRAHRMRSFLTTLGIVIGIGTVILIVSVLEGFRSSIEHDLNVLGANTFQVQRYDFSNQGFEEAGRRQYRKRLTRDLADAIRENCASVKLVGAENWKHGQVIAYKGEKTNPNISVGGATPEFALTNGYFIAEGRFLTSQDVHLHRKVVILGMDVVDKLFPLQEPLGREVRIAGQKFRVVGVFDRQGSSTFGQSRDDLVVIPITTWEELFGKNHSVNITVMAKSPELYETAQAEVIGILRKKRKVPPGEENDFFIFSNETLVESFNNIAQKIQLAGIGIGIISLIVGGIGVMNIMLVSVTERTREIGIRKAVGAREQDILKQFLMEAITLCLVGGILGFLVGIGLAAIISVLAKFPMAVPLWSIVASLVVTTLIGLASGLYPARKAARLQPIETLRYE